MLKHCLFLINELVLVPSTSIWLETIESFQWQQDIRNGMRAGVLSAALFQFPPVMRVTAVARRGCTLRVVGAFN